MRSGVRQAAPVGLKYGRPLKYNQPQEDWRDSLRRRFPQVALIKHWSEYK